LKIIVRKIKQSLVALAQRSDHIIGFPDESAVPVAPDS
jgi:tRNA A37 methylthiotransferase MiaB